MLKQLLPLPHSAIRIFDDPGEEGGTSVSESELNAWLGLCMICDWHDQLTNCIETVHDNGI